MTYRRAVIKGGWFVPHDRPVVLWVQRANGMSETVTLTPTRETLGFIGKSSSPLLTWLLVLDQLAGFFFIGLAALLVWRRPMWATWGFLLYAPWYNSGQIDAWYANLPAVGLSWFGWLEAVFSAAGLTGLLMFALHFPRDSIEGWRQRARPWLFVPFVALTLLNVWAFRNFTEGVPTERDYDIYYYLVLAVYVTVFALFVHTYVTQPPDRPRIRWIFLGALSGLLCFLFATVYNETSMLDWISINFPEWLWQVLYAVNVLFPLAVAYAIVRHRVISVRLVLNRSFVVLIGFLLTTVAYAGLELSFHERIGHNAPWIGLIGAMAFVAMPS